MQCAKGKESIYLPVLMSQLLSRFSTRLIEKVQIAIWEAAKGLRHFLDRWDFPAAQRGLDRAAGGGFVLTPIYCPRSP